MRTTTRTARLIGAAAVALAATGCALTGGYGAGTGGTGGTGGPQPSGEADEVALEVVTFSAWPGWRVPSAPPFPDLVVYGDGSFVVTTYDEATERHELRAGRLDDARLADLLAGAEGLLGRDYGEPGLDGSTTTLRFGPGTDAAGQEVGVWVPELVDGYEGAARDSREAFSAFLDDVDSAAETDGSVWRPDRWLLLSQAPPVDDDADRPAPVWPFAVDLTAARPVPDAAFACQVVGGDAGARIVAEQERSEERRADTGAAQGWRVTAAGDTTVDVVVLPRLPGVGCRDLGDYRYRLD
ncbi:hypothetical protein GCM10023340_43500 [Nocardioides marinquilinus]|uniref:Lipoprotein n=1 Tax=Nocardioides marinquilinus TaxID=1210400 RepID=A0ABP9Q5W8_9ACTN